MIPSTTPTFILTLKNAGTYLEETVNIRIDIRQQDVLISKKMDEIIIDKESNTVSFTLSQKESSRFLYKKGKIEIQIHGLLNDGTAWKTYVVSTPVDKTLTREVIQNG